MNHLNASAASVLVIVDPDFGEKLRTIPVERPLWITMSPANEPIVRSLWVSQRSSDHLTATTGFRFDEKVEAEERFLAELDTIDLHHGPYSSTSSYMEIVVTGAGLTPEIRAVLSGLGGGNPFTRIFAGCQGKQFALAKIVVQRCTVHSGS